MNLGISYEKMNPSPLQAAGYPAKRDKFFRAFIPAVNCEVFSLKINRDGEYATVHLGELDGSGVLLFLVKRENKWIPLVSGNGNPSCSEVLPLREKYNLPKDFLPCAEELE